MPTIEIASLNASEIGLNQDNYDVAIIEENKLESHRGLFNDFLLQQQGTIVHIGNPNFKNDKEGGFFAGGIIDWDFEEVESIALPNFDNNETGADQQSTFQFLEEFKLEIFDLMRRAFHASPVQTIFFLTDYQFGPESGDYRELQSLDAFRKEHDTNGLCWNVLYTLSEE